MTDNAYDIAHLATDLIAFSPVALKLCEVIDDKASNAKSVSSIIKQDPVLTTNILKLANSLFYGYSQEISDIDEAVNRIGTSEVFRIALSVSTSETFRGIPETLITMSDFWNHSILCAFAAQELADTLNLKASGALYAAGLLHDIGQLILFSNRPKQSVEMLERCLDNYEEVDQCTAEMEIFGFTHAQVGMELAKMWNFPPMLQECIAYHHQPSEAKLYAQESLVIGMANILAVLIEIQSYDLNDLPPIDAGLRKAFNKNMNNIASVCQRIENRYLENKSLVLNTMI